MLKQIANVDIQKLYKTGERNFPHQQLRRANLQGADLQGINLQGSDLSYADLREANLRGANLTNCYLNEANLTGADLTGADLTGSYFIKAYLSKVNCYRAIVKDAYFTGSFLTRANLCKADLSGSFFNGSHLTGAIFKDASYSNDTRFDQGINPKELGMIKISALIANSSGKTTIAEIISNFEKIAEITSHYLGGAMTVRNFEQSRPDVDWLNEFSMDKQGKIIYQGSLNNKATSLQLKWVEKWTKSFVKSSSLVVRDLPRIIEEKQLIL